IASARLMPIALTLMRTSFGPGAGTWTSTNSRTSGPPAFANLIERDMAVSVRSDWGCGPILDHQERQLLALPLLTHMAPDPTEADENQVVPQCRGRQIGSLGYLADKRSPPAFEPRKDAVESGEEQRVDQDREDSNGQNEILTFLRQKAQC